MQEVENMLRAIKPVEVFTEPFIETKYDIHLQVGKKHHLSMVHYKYFYYFGKTQI